jgi:nitroreductase
VLEVNETLDVIQRRRSVRKYRSDPIPEEDLTRILEAARQAPTGGNRQQWRMIVVRDPDLRRRTAEACNGQTWMARAPVILCLVLLPEGWVVDGTIVLDHAILAATSMGYGTCWIGAFDGAAVKGVLGIPEDHGIVCLTPVGVAAEQPRPRPRKAREELFSLDDFAVPFFREVAQ